MTVAIQQTAELSPEEAKRELARRKLARRRLVAFAEYAAPWYQTARVHKLVAKKLERVGEYVRTRGRSGTGRLIIEMPPRTGKTELVSKLFPAWMLGLDPNMRAIISSYAAPKAHDNSRKMKEYVEGDEFQAVFGVKAAIQEPVQVSMDSRAAKLWELAPPHRGGVVASGVRGGITGWGAHLLITDDLFKDREEASSEARQKLVWGWWSSTAYTRLEEGGAIVHIGTRWHENDLIGRLLKAMATNPEADQYEVVSLPGLAFEEEGYAISEQHQREEMGRGIWLNEKDPLGRKPGEAIWPGKFSRENLLKKKANMLPEDWAALYDQQPRPKSGGMFGQEWEIIEPNNGWLEGLRWVRPWDLALTEQTYSDYTVGGHVTMDDMANVYLKNVIRGKWEWPKARRKIKAISEEENKGITYGIESVAFQTAAFQELRDDPEFRRPVVEVKPDRNKLARLEWVSNKYALGKFFLVRGPWIGEFIAEGMAMRRDMKHKHDDQFDMVAMGMQMISGMLEGDLMA